MSLPEPLTPSNCNLQDFAFMPVDVRRLLASETWILGNGDERAASMSLWLESWHQIPAASLPSDDRMLAHLAQCSKWTRVKAHVLKGWVECGDGRLYHPVVAEKALESWIEKLLNSISGATGNAKRWGIEVDTQTLREQLQQAILLLKALSPRSRTLKKKAVLTLAMGSGGEDKLSPPDSTAVSPPDSPPDSDWDRNRQGQGQGQGFKDQEQELGAANASPPAGGGSPEVQHEEKSKRGSRLPEDWSLPGDWLDWALTKRPEFTAADVQAVADEFADHWRAKSGKDAAKADWLATWRNWVRRQRAPGAGLRSAPSSALSYPRQVPRNYQLGPGEFWGFDAFADHVYHHKTHHMDYTRKNPGGDAC
ncbi:DUF1376 domain-containing protein [Pseudomonas protegens]|uniref:DUF1376 domain-containing protein n=1 Tax=Pseudomonas protegens TaxID=380021 RepID=UPI00381CE2AE